ncbi:MAG: hypothetical protein JWN70_4714 [Planctomycetaceae bacterium]|nr:hypothetical protein [Planctomycetaceae bacterium]
MSDVRQTTRQTPSSGGIHPAPEGVSAFAQREGWRVDPAHPLSGSESVAPPLGPAGSEYDVIQEPYVAPTSAAPLRTDLPLGDPLLQARQIAEHLQHRYADLERREQRLNVQLADLDQERRSIRMWATECEAVLHERDAELLQRDTFVSEREAACLELEHEMQARKASMLEQEHDLQNIQARWREEWELERQGLKQELDQQSLQLQNEQAHFRLVKEGQLAEIQQERSLLLNRIRFQEEHLQKLRREFEVAQAAFHAERQRTQAMFLETDTQLELRRDQLIRYRLQLEERDAALQRQQVLIGKSRRAEVDGLFQERQRLEEDQRDWQMVRGRQQAELERKNEVLQLNAENLDARQSRLEQLRLELEETNRKTMEMRLAVEEACAQLAQAVGPDLARQRIEASQYALSDHYRQARETLVKHRQELEQFHRSVLQQRDEFRSEQQTLAEWIAKRDEELAVRESQFREEQAVILAREESWQNTRDLWLHEKLEAEAVIRDLLQRLETPPS